MRSSSRLPLQLLLAALLLPPLLAWGPFSHVEFGGDALPPPASPSQLRAFFAGCVSPDALKSVNQSLHSLREFAPFAALVLCCSCPKSPPPCACVRGVRVRGASLSL
jgi:hypothetical protein